MWYLWETPESPDKQWLKLIILRYYYISGSFYTKMGEIRQTVFFFRFRNISLLKKYFNDNYHLKLTVQVISQSNRGMSRPPQKPMSTLSNSTPKMQFANSARTVRSQLQLLLYNLLMQPPCPLSPPNKAYNALKHGMGKVGHSKRTRYPQHKVMCTCYAPLFL